MTDKEEMATLESYLAMYEKIKAKVGDEHAARTILGELAKDRRAREIRAEREAQNGKPATSKQIEYLRDLGVEVSEGLTKAEASKMIDNVLAEEKNA